MCYDMDWLEIKIRIPAEKVEEASAIANMVVPYGIYIEDYSDLEQGAWEIAHIDLIDEELLHHVFQNFNKIITIEDGTIVGGLGSAVLEFMNDHHYQAQIIRLGIPDQFIEHGSQQQLYKDCKFDEESIRNHIIDLKQA